MWPEKEKTGIRWNLNVIRSSSSGAPGGTRTHMQWFGPPCRNRLDSAVFPCGSKVHAPLGHFSRVYQFLPVLTVVCVFSCPNCVQNSLCACLNCRLGQAHIYGIAGDTYPAMLGAGSSPISMSSSVPIRSSLTRLMCSSARIWSSVHHAQSCPSTSNSRRSNGCATTVTRAPHWPGSARCATARSAPPTDTAGGSQTDKQKNGPAPLTMVGEWGGAVVFSGFLSVP